MAPNRRLVVAVDQGEPSRIAFHWALNNFFRKSDQVLILTAFTYAPASSLSTLDLTAGGEYSVPIVVPEDPTVEKELTEKSQAIVDVFLSLARQSNIPSEGDIVKGTAGESICEKSGAYKADVIIVGTHDYGVIKRTIWGSVSSYVVHHSQVPVLVVRGKTEKKSDPEKRVITVAVDNTEESIFAFNWTLENVVLSTDKVLLVHVTYDRTFSATNPEDVVFEEGFAPINSDKSAVDQLVSGEKLIELLLRKIEEKDNKIQAEGKIVSGEAGVKLCSELELSKADLVVVGTRNSSVFIKTFLGSVSDHLIHHSPCPVVVAKAPIIPESEKKD